LNAEGELKESFRSTCQIVIPLRTELYDKRIYRHYTVVSR
jgi:hypothetical protein